MIYLFFGEDTFTLVAELRTLREKFLRQYPSSLVEELEIKPEMNEKALRSRLQELLESRSLFAAKRLVILRDLITELHKFPRAEIYLLAALTKISRDLILVFAQSRMPDRRLGLFQTLQDLAKVKEFTIPRGKALEVWIKNFLKSSGFPISAEALKELLGRLNEDYTLWQVQGELEKLLLYCWGEKHITLEAVRQNVFPNISRNIFDLTNLVAEGEIAQAARLLEQMVSGVSSAELRSQIIQIVGALAIQVRSLLLVKDLAGTDPAAIAKILDWKEGRVWINLRLAKKFTKDRLICLLQDLKAIDYRLKTSEEPAKLLLTLFFQKAGAAYG